MSLTTGRGPLGPNPAGQFTPPIAGPTAYAEPFPRRVRGITGGRTVIDCDLVLLLHRPGKPPTWAFPAAAVDGLPADALPEAPGHVHVAWDLMDEWYEEDEQVHGHPRNPYHRVDCVRTSRRLQVEVGGVVLVDTAATLGVYETSLAPRLYVSRDQVRTDLLVASPTTTYCPYKGTASHWHAVVGADVIEDVAWSYEDPLPESLPLRGMLSFYPSRATVRADLPAG